MVWFVVDMIRCSCSEPLAEEAVWALQDDVAMEEVVGLYSEACRLDLQAQAVGAPQKVRILFLQSIELSLRAQVSTRVRAY